MIPFFFSFMLLKNEWSMVWTMSTFAGLFLLILLINDWLLVTLLTLSAYAFATLVVFFLDGTNGYGNFQLEYIPIILFGIVGSIIFSHKKNIAQKTKISLLHSLGGSVAHEMRNPLNTIINAMGSVQSILPEKPNPEAKASNYMLSRSGLISLHNVVEESTDTVMRANKIIDSILAGMQGKSVDPTTFKRTSATNSIQSAINSFSYSSPDERKIVNSLAKNDFDFFGDKDLLIYVLFNLIKNALYYKNKPGFKLEILTEKGETINVIKVFDTGPGIPASKREKIFDSFYTSGKKGGVGLGLAFCKRVVTAFGGTITCNSKENEWTKFIITLPLYNSKRSEQLKKEVLQTKNILVTDNDPANRFHAEKHFTEWSCRVEQAENGAQALALIARKKFDLILMDMEMPIMNGDDVSRRIRFGEISGQASGNKHKDIPIIGMTSSASSNLTQRALGAGMNRCISRPLTREHIRSFFEEYFFSEKKPVTYTTSIFLKNKNVLVVDDNLTSRKFMSIILERMGAYVGQAENGEDAIKCLDNKEYDIVFMDMEMPVLNGVETTKRIRQGYGFKRFKRFKNIPIIALTGNTDPGNIELTKQSGMNDHLGKPVGRDDLAKVLSTWLQK
ncbi:MAG: response regulator [Chlorobiales bacterium]|nr:response regulator [Chlorobiales bacterium]